MYTKEIIEIAPQIPEIRFRLSFCEKLSKYQVKTPKIAARERNAYHDAGTSLMTGRIIACL